MDERGRLQWMLAIGVVALSSLVFSVIAIQQDPQDTVQSISDSGARVYQGDKYSNAVGSREEGGYTAAAVEATWSASETVSITGQFQAASAGANGSVTATLLVDGVSVASSTATLKEGDIVTIPIQRALDDISAAEHTVEIVALFIGKDEEKLGIDEGQIVVTVFPREEE